MPWDYLNTPELQTRQLLAAHFLRGCPRILEIGGYENPVTSWLMHVPREVVVIDPLMAPCHLRELNGQPCDVRHIPVDLDHFELDHWLGQPYGLVFCGMDLNLSATEPGAALKTAARFLLAVSQADTAIIEYPQNWPPSARFFDLLLSVLQPRIAADIRLDLSAYRTDPAITDEIRGRLARRLVVLKDPRRCSVESELIEPLAQGLFGSAGAKVVLLKSHGDLRPVPDAFDLSRFESMASSARVTCGPELEVTTPPEAWSYAALLPLAGAAAGWEEGARPLPAYLKVGLEALAGEMGIGVVQKDMRQIDSERLVRPSEQDLQNLELFIPDLRRSRGLLCRNGSLQSTVSRVRISSVQLWVPSEAPGK